VNGRKVISPKSKLNHDDGACNLKGKYDSLFFKPPPVSVTSEGVKQYICDKVPGHDYRSVPNLVLDYHLVTRPYVSKTKPHTHQYHEFLAWYSCNPNNPEEFGAEIVLHLGEEQEKHVITTSTLVSLPPGFPHCPMEITRVDKPIFQIAMSIEV
jgi:uncharacterized RmlC-like cupin family protein